MRATRLESNITVSVIISSLMVRSMISVSLRAIYGVMEKVSL